MIHVLAHIRLKSGMREDFLKEFHRIVPLVKAEPGCLEYGPAVDAETPIETQTTDSDRVVIVEKWESVENLQAHLAAPHMQEYRPRVKDMIVESRLHVLTPA